ncbi:Ribonuclease H1, N-terminal [Trema orientale]|uniref:Ribonuclease H1, N-terminal n=1 Tax=Trema orientale TaxID=63057 RepID=A0A2P5B9C2_TREOI|nr:Ribonuclease H1, N-terminal [Trema orientale]
MAASSSEKTLPAGVGTTETKGEIIPGALRLSDRLSFSDFSKTTWAFKAQEGIELAKPEKILIDNLWVAHNRHDTKHIIATLNGLSIYFSKKNDDFKCYVVFNGPRPGIYKSWASVTQITKGFNSQYKKYNTAQAAIIDAQTYIGQKYYIDPDIKDHMPNGPSNVESIIEAHTFNKEIINLKKQVIELEEKNQMLQERVIIAEKRKIDQDLQISYAGATSEEGLTEGINMLDSGPSDPWVEWMDNRIELAQELRPKSIRPPSNIQVKNLEGVRGGSIPLQEDQTCDQTGGAQPREERKAEGEEDKQL